MKTTLRWATSLFAALIIHCPAMGLQGGGILAGAGSDAAGRQWPTYNNDYAGQRFSYLDQINAKNVSALTEVCRVQVADGGSFQTSPVLMDGVMYVTAPQDTIAIDPATCKVLWKLHYTPTGHEPYATNRGLAYSNGRLFRGTPDGHLLALDARNGAVIWDNTIADSNLGECLAAAPAAWNGLVIIGTGCGDWGVRGRVMAFDIQTGREVWRFYTIPRGKEVGADTWKGVAGKYVGGGGTWSTYTIDVTSGELFVPVGNPAPDFLPDERRGDNLFTNSIVVLDMRTGALKWWYQAIKNDPWDHDMAAAPMLYQDKQRRNILAAAGKDGYLHLVDRATRKLLSKTSVTTQLKTAKKPAREGTLICPGTMGGTEWNGPAYDEHNHAVVVGAVDWCTVVTAGKAESSRGVIYLGGDLKPVGNPQPRGWITSVSAENGAVRWKYHADAPIIAAVTPTAGGVVFAGDSAGNLLALDSAIGAVLLKKPLDASMAGGIMTYAVDGRQYVAAAAGSVSRATFGGVGVPSVIILAVKEGPRGEESGAAPPPAANPKRGRAVYSKLCSTCHGPTGEGGVGPKLHGVAGRLTADQVEGQIRNPRGVMPRMYPGTLSEQNVLDVAAFVRMF